MLLNFPNSCRLFAPDFFSCGRSFRLSYSRLTQRKQLIPGSYAVLLAVYRSLPKRRCSQRPDEITSAYKCREAFVIELPLNFERCLRPTALIKMSILRSDLFLDDICLMTSGDHPAGHWLRRQNPRATSPYNLHTNPVSAPDAGRRH